MRNEALHPHRQQGMALLIALVVLVVVSILGATAMRSALFQNRISINQQISQMVFQGAESGIQSVFNVANPNTNGGVAPQNTAHVFYRALVLGTPVRICYGDDGVAAADAAVANPADNPVQRALSGDDFVFTFATPCPARADSPILVNAVVSETPPNLPASLPIEGTNLCGNQSGCYSAVQLYSRAFASIANLPVRSSHVQLWGIVAPNAND